MPDDAQHFRYVAVAATGRRVTGVLAATAEAAAYETLRAQGCSPVSIDPVRRSLSVRSTGALKDREVVDIVGNLGHLLRAGADMRTALGILGARTSRRPTQATCAKLLEDIAGGAALDTTFSKHLGRHGPFVGAMVAAGEASGDIGSGLTRAAESIEGRAKIRAKLGSIMAYPLFVLVSTIAAVLALLLFVVPALAPLIQDAQADPPVVLGVMVAASEAIRGHFVAISVAFVTVLAGGLVAQKAGLLHGVVDRFLHTGPVGGTARGLTFGAFAGDLGGMLAAGAPMADALRLSVRTLRSPTARERLDTVLHAVRQGRSLSSSLEEVRGFPGSIARLAAVGEATGSLGPMLQRGGALEEEAAMARIERIGQLLGPMLIVALGALVGLLMAGLLSGVSQLGQSALQ